MMKKIKFAVVGTNNISDKFVFAAKLSKCAEISAVFSRKLDTGAAFAKKHDIKKVFCNFDEMLAESEIEAVYIASPHMCHPEQSVRALGAGKHVLCEKIISPDKEGFTRQKSAMEKSGKVLLEAMRPDFDPAMKIIKENLPKLGKIRRVVFEYCQYSSRYDSFKLGELPNAFNPKMKNTALADIGIYPLHMCINLFGKPKRINAEASFLKNGFEAAGALLLSYGDMFANIIYSKVSESVNPSVIEGELGSLSFDKINAPSKIVLHLRGEEPKLLDYTPVPNNMVYEIDAFCEMVGGVLNFKPYLELSEAALEVVDAAYEITGAKKYFD